MPKQLSALGRKLLDKSDPSIQDVVSIFGAVGQLTPKNEQKAANIRKLFFSIRRDPSKLFEDRSPQLSSLEKLFSQKRSLGARFGKDWLRCLDFLETNLQRILCVPYQQTMEETFELDLPGDEENTEAIDLHMVRKMDRISARLSKPSAPQWPVSKPKNITLPKQFGRYEVLGLLGRGAMGVVYLGLDPNTQRKVALKTLAQLSDDKRSSKLVQEAKTSALLNHPACVRVIDIIEAQVYGTTLPVIVMEYVKGLNGQALLEHTLWDQVDGNPFTPTSALLMLEQMLLGLVAAHQAGIVHRDIKPDNFMVSSEFLEILEAKLQKNKALTALDIENCLLENRESTWFKLNDLGLARLREHDKSLDPMQSLSTMGTMHDLNKNQSIVLEATNMAGTPVYMSPEQLVPPHEVSGRTDIFALGLTFYRLLTGGNPLKGRIFGEKLTIKEDPLSLLMAMIRVPDSIQQSLDTIHDPAFSRVTVQTNRDFALDLINRMTQRTRTNRPSSRQIQEELQQLFSANHTKTPKLKVSSRINRAQTQSTPSRERKSPPILLLSFATLMALCAVILFARVAQQKRQLFELETTIHNQHKALEEAREQVKRAEQKIRKLHDEYQQALQRAREEKNKGQ